MPKPDPGRTAVYRLFGTEGVLLYVGIARRIGLRWDQHATSQPWWPDVLQMTVEWYPSRTEAETAEREAIRTEEPKYNVAHYPELRIAATSSRYPASPWIRREQVSEQHLAELMQVREQHLSKLVEHIDPRDKVIDMLLACIPLTSTLWGTVRFILRELADELNELGEEWGEPELPELPPHILARLRSRSNVAR